MEMPFLEIDGDNFTRSQFDIKPIEGYELPKNETTGKALPYCCENHTLFYENLKKRFLKFPNCCKEHKRIAKSSLFEKEKYLRVPEKILIQTSYTQYHIIKRIDSEDWYEDITEYIDFNVFSFGHPAIGLGDYLRYILNSLKDKIWVKENNISIQKSVKLSEFLNQYYNEGEKDDTSLSILHSTYQDWMKIFPFNLSFFRGMKSHFENTLPFIKQQLGTNRYSGISKAKLHTKSSLIDFLIGITNNILTQFNSLSQIEGLTATDADKIKLELIVEQRRMKINQGYNNNSTNEESRYRRILKEWFNDEKKFIKEITPLLKSVELNFINDMIDGIKTLQKNDTNESCIMNVRNDKPDKETSVRYWFKTFFTARYPNANITSEEEKGKGRIDLKVSHISFGDKLVEFKGWWNQDKKNTPEQICSYLTDFEKDGYIFMINHLKTKDITADYKKLVTDNNCNYLPNSWVAHKVGNTDLRYYESKHQLLGKEKIIYHFIFNAFY